MYARDYSKFSAAKFRNEGLQIDFFNDLENVNDQFSDFYSKLAKCVDLNAPMKKLKPKEVI